MIRTVARKGLSCLLVINLVCLLLAGCGADGSVEGNPADSSIGSEEGQSSAADDPAASQGSLEGDLSGDGQVNILDNPAYNPGDRQVLTVGATLRVQEFMDQILAFNESNPSYFIEIQSYYTGLDAEAARNLDTQLSHDILSGEGPDLMIWSRAFYTPALVSEKLMLDLNEFMDADPDFHREDYLENILRAFEIDGSLYLFPSSYAVYTVCGKAEELGVDRGIMENWEFGEMLDAYENSPHAEMFSSIPNKEYTLDDTCRGSMDNFVDWSSGECHFDTPDFVRLLELSNTFPNGFDNVPDPFSEAYSSGRIFLNNYFSLCEPWSMADVRVDFGDASLRWPGNPVPNGEKDLGGGVAVPWDECFSICKSCSDPNAAWEVVKSLIVLATDAHRDTWGNPVLRSAFEEKIQDALTVEYETVNGVEQEKIRYEVILSERGGKMGFSCITEEEAKLYRSMIENTHRSYFCDMVMMEIIIEEAKVYFGGDKDAAAAADSIQERVSAYVSEHMN